MVKRIHLKLLFILLLSNVWIATYAQSDTSILDQSDMEFLDTSGSNSFKAYYDRAQIPIHYLYTAKTQTHDYSNNWDFDGDGKTDNLYFIGTGGSHLYFYLRIILSSDKKVRNFSFLSIDFPVLGNVDELKKSSFYPPPSLPQFVVDYFLDSHELGNSLKYKIYLRLDEHWTQVPPKWKKLGVNSSYLLLYYDKEEIRLRNFIK